MAAFTETAPRATTTRRLARKGNDLMVNLRFYREKGKKEKDERKGERGDGPGEKNKGRKGKSSSVRTNVG